MTSPTSYLSFFFNDPATPQIYTLSLHDALPIYMLPGPEWPSPPPQPNRSTSRSTSSRAAAGDRKSTRLNSSHANISYAVFCLKKKNKNAPETNPSATNTQHHTTDSAREDTPSSN